MLIATLAESSDHATIGDALMVFAMLAGIALVVWVISRFF